MSNLLLKDILVTILVPGTPATPGSPGSPGSPAWDEVIDYDTYGIIGWVYGYLDSHDNFIRLDPGQTPPSGATVIFEPIYGPIHVHEVIHHPAVPAVPPVPGTPGTPPVLATNYQLGWNASADSIDSITGDGEYKFSVDSNTIGCFTGLSAIAVGDDYRRIQYGLYFTDRKVEVWESGVHVAASGTFVTSDVFTIRRLGSEVAYYQGSTLLYRSLTPSSGTLVAYTDMYAGGDQIDNASLSTSVDAALSGTTPGQLAVSVPQPVFWASEKNGLLNISVPQPRIWASADGSLRATWPMPVVSILSHDFAGGTVYLPTPAVDIEGDEETPAYGILQTDTPYPSMYMSVDVIAGAINISVPQPKFLGWTGGGILQTSVPQPRFLAFGNAQLGFINAFAPMARAFIDGDVLPDYFNLGIHATAPRATAHMYSGAFIKTTAPRPTAAIVATTSNHFTITASAPVATAVVTGLAGSDSAIFATAPKATARVYAGGRIVATAPQATAAVAVRTGTVLAITATAPEATASVSGFGGHRVIVVATAPRASALRGYSFITAAAPMARAQLAANSAAYAITDAYSVTLNNPAKPVTRYTNYPHHSIVRFGNDYLGFGPTGVFKLTGVDDAGTPILWSFTFGNTTEVPGDEFGQGFRKTNYGAYFDGRFTGTAMLSVSVDDGTVYTYSKLMPNNQRDTLRFVPGQGLRGFSWQFGLSGAGPCDVYRAEFLQRALSRKVKHG